MDKNKVFLLLVILISLWSCRRSLNEITNNEVAQHVDDLHIPIDFNWELKQYVDINIKIEAAKGYQPKSKISIYSDNPENGGSLYLTGSVASGKAFTSKVNLPPYLKELYLVCENPFGSVTHAKVPIEAGIVSHTFSWLKNRQISPPVNYKNTADGPDCSEGCDEYISGGGTYSIKEGKTYCVEDDFDGKINFENWNGGGTLRICGTAKINNNQYITGGSQIVVAEGGELTISKNVDLSGGEMIIYQNATIDIDDVSLGTGSAFTVYEGAEVEMRKFDAWGSDAQVVNYGSITVEKNSYHAGSLENYGSLTYDKKLDMNKINFINTGELLVKEDGSCYGTGSTMENYGNLQWEKNFEFGNNTIFSNYGSILVKECSY